MRLPSCSNVLSEGWATPSRWSGHALLRGRAAEPPCVSALRVSIVAAGARCPGWVVTIIVVCVARALDTTTRHQRTIAAYMGAMPGSTREEADEQAGLAVHWASVHHNAWLYSRE